MASSHIKFFRAKLFCSGSRKKPTFFWLETMSNFFSKIPSGGYVAFFHFLRKFHAAPRKAAPDKDFSGMTG